MPLFLEKTFNIHQLQRKPGLANAPAHNAHANGLWMTPNATHLNFGISFWQAKKQFFWKSHASSRIHRKPLHGIKNLKL